jgi:hypothetical protein
MTDELLDARKTKLSLHKTALKSKSQEDHNTLPIGTITIP